MEPKPEEVQDASAEPASRTKETLHDKPSEAAAPSKQEAPSEDVPDPDEDDLDDLDDMLDEFTPSKSEFKTPTIPSGPGRPLAPDATEGISDEDFEKQLQAGMAELLNGLDSDDMQAQLQQMMKSFGGAAAAAAEADVANSASQEKSGSEQAKATAAAEKSFQETIKETMERMKASDTQSTAAVAGDSSDDFMAEMLKAMQDSGLDGEGNEEDFSKMLLGMMEQLTNKEILYDPMKELDDKFPAWMEKNEGKVKEEDMKRYREQKVYVREIVQRFERMGYSDDNAADREYIVERMQKMQAAGSPPPDLVGDMEAAQEAFGAPEEGCAQQ